MTVNTVMMMTLLSGTMTIKNTQRPKNKDKRRTPAHCLAPPSCDGLVHVTRREVVVEVTDSCFKIT